MFERRGKAEMAELVDRIRERILAGKKAPEIAAELDLSKQHVWDLCSKHNIRLPETGVIVKTEGLNWKHPPHIPFLPCR